MPYRFCVLFQFGFSQVAFRLDKPVPRHVAARRQRGVSRYGCSRNVKITANSDLDVSYVSSLSLYFITAFGIRGLMSLLMPRSAGKHALGQWQEHKTGPNTPGYRVDT